MKCALVFIGESFRLGSQHTRNRGSQEAYPQQISASRTHKDLIAFINREWGYTVDVYIHTYSTRYDDELLGVYDPVTHSVFLDPSNTVTRSINDHVALSKAGIAHNANYDFIWFIRIDVYLKEALLERLVQIGSTAFQERILYPSMCYIGHHKTRSWPRVNDTMLSIPMKYRELLDSGELTLDHDSWASIANKRPDVNLGFLLDTLHDSDSEKDWNPIYTIVNRKECSKWHSEGWRFSDAMCDAVCDK